MTFWNAQHLADIVQGRWLGDPPPAGMRITGVGIDTRTLKPGDVYVAIQGENHDGHEFIDKAFDAGVSFAIASKQSALGNPHSATLLVPDTVAALQQLAADYRGHLAAGRCKVIAVAGSNGKTTTRHLLHHVLAGGGLVGTQSPKSFNNHLGVPLTLLSAQPDHDFCAAEIGTNHPGEIAALAEIMRPDAAVITSIGAEHLEFLGDLTGVAKEEASLLPHVRPGGFIAVESEAAAQIAPYYDVRDRVVMLPVQPEAAAGVIPADFPLPGAHNRSNAALAVAVARWMNRGDSAIREALRTATTPEGRMQVLHYGSRTRGAQPPGFKRGPLQGGAAQGVTVIHDAYNANPDSVQHALEFLSQQPGRKVAVLADMLELGGHATAAHARAAALAQQTADRCVFLGRLFPDAQPWSDDTPGRIAALLKPGDTVLLKGSRGMRLERILPAIETRFGSVQTR